MCIGQPDSDLLERVAIARVRLTSVSHRHGLRQMSENLVHHRTSVLSEKKVTMFIGISRIMRMRFCVNRRTSIAPISSNLGTVLGFNGATLFFNVIIRLLTVASSYSHWKNTTAPYTFKEASTNVMTRFIATFFGSRRHLGSLTSTKLSNCRNHLTVDFIWITSSQY